MGAPTGVRWVSRLCGLKGEPLIRLAFARHLPLMGRLKVSLRLKADAHGAPLRCLCVIHNARFEPARHPRALAKDLARICCFVVGTGVLDCPF